MSDLIGKLGRESVEEEEGKLSISQTQLRESHLASFQAVLFKQMRSNVSELLNNLVILVVRNNSLYNMVVWNDLLKPI